jgi:hypothetical protein
MTKWYNALTWRVGKTERQEMYVKRNNEPRSQIIFDVEKQ